LKKKIPFQVIDDDEIKYKVPFAAILAGQSGSGKTTFLIRLLSFLKFLFKPIPVQVVYCYGEYNDAIPYIQQMDVTIHHGLPTDEFLSTCDKPLLLILDDLMLQADKKYLDSLFTVKSHHRNMGVIFVVQNAFDKNLKTARDNSQYLILMNSPSAKRQIRDLGSSLYPHKSKQFMEIYETVTKDKFGYLVIDLNPSTDNQLRLRSNIFPGEITRVFNP
jgi:hypothetical protein